MRSRILLAFLLLAVIAQAQGGPAMTTVTNQFAGANVDIVVVANEQFTTPDGYTVPYGQQYTAQSNSSGVLSIALPPNIGSTPAGSTYTVYYSTPYSSYQQVWMVPQTPTTVNVAAVNVWLPHEPQNPNYQVPFVQLTPPDGCAPGGFIWWTGDGWECVPTQEQNFSAATANYTLQSTDRTITFNCAAACNAMLPAASNESGETHTIINSGTTTVTIQPAAGDTIQGNANIALTTQYQHVTLVSDGDHTWYEVAP
jgi:hypothetical protein